MRFHPRAPLHLLLSPFVASSFVALGLMGGLGCAAASSGEDPAEVDVEETADELRAAPTAEISLSGARCVLGRRTLTVRGGRSFRLANTSSVALDVFIDWVNGEGESEGIFETLAPGEIKRLRAPRYAAWLYEGGESISFPIQCAPDGDDATTADPSGTLLIKRR